MIAADAHTAPDVDHDAAHCSICSTDLLRRAIARIEEHPGESLYDALAYYVSVDAFAASLGWTVNRRDPLA